MPFCPKCGAEYDEGFTVCADCGCALTDSPPPDENPEPEEGSYCAMMRRTYLTSTANKMESDRIVGLLNQEGIPAFAREQEAGNYLNIYMGYSSYGENIYVDKDDYKAASTLLAQAFPIGASPGEEIQDPAQAPALPKNKKRLRAWLLILLMCGIPFAIVGIVQMFAS